MSYYIFKFTKGDAVIEAESQDTELLAREFEKSVSEAFGITCDNPRRSNLKVKASTIRKPAYTDIKEKKKVVDAVSKEFETFLQKNAQAPAKQPARKIEEAILAEPAVLESQPEEAVVKTDIQPKVPETPLQEFEVVSTDELLISESEETGVATEETTQEETTSPQVESVVEPKTIQQVPKPGTAPPVKTEAVPAVEAVDLPVETHIIDNIKSIEDLFAMKSPATMLDYLVVAAYYLKYYENLDSYTLKQLNLKILPATKVPVNHAVIQEAVSLNYIEVVPDFTGSAYVTEYTITDEGARFITNEL